MTSVLIVEDHTIFASVLLRMLREQGHMDVVAIAPSAEAALDQIPNLVVDLALVDVSLPHKSGIDLVLDLQQMYPDMPPGITRAQSLTAGARGYLLKDNTEEILDGIRRVLQGEIYVSEQIR